MADPVPVSIAFHRLFCYHGSDESDSEPYLWVIGFTLDGRTLTHRPDSPTLDGGAAYFMPAGSHDNIGGPMGIGTERVLPPSVARFDTTLQPIVLTFGGQTLEVPGWIGLIGMLMEEDSTSDDGAGAAHEAINTLFRNELDDAVEEINLAGMAAEVAQAVNGGADPVVAAQALFTARVDKLVERIQRYARAVVIDAIVRNLSFPAVIVEAADPDEFLGMGVHVFGQADLAATTHTQRLEFTDRIAQPGVHIEASDYAFNLHGEAWQRIEVFFEPVTDQVPPGRWQVTGLSRAGRPGKQFISALGGSFADGTPWLLPKGRVMDLIGAGSHTFFVRGASGVESQVMVEPDPVNPFFPSLTTTADSDPTNNLGGLPQATVAIRHTRPVD